MKLKLSARILFALMAVAVSVAVLIPHDYTRASEYVDGPLLMCTGIGEPPLKAGSDGEPDGATIESIIRETTAGKDAPVAPTKTVLAADLTRLKEIRYWSNRDYTRIAIDFSGKVPYAHPELLPANPELGKGPRLFVDFQGAAIANSLSDPDTPEPGCFTLPIGDGLLKKARAGQYKKDVVRVVLDIERIDRFNAFPMPGETYRYVIDVYGSPSAKLSLPNKAAGSMVGKKDADPVGGFDYSKWFKPPQWQIDEGPKKYTVVLDAGHGGKDPGAVGRSSKEKHLALAIAKETKRAIESERNDVKVILTRNDDRYLTLVERTAMANTINADLFVSIHINAARREGAAGVETYYLDNTTDRAALKLAAKENFVKETELVDSRDTTNKILADLITMSKVEDSVPLAESIQKSIVASQRKLNRDVINKGVKKAPFWVLTGATMPCALVEVGFISNRKEEVFLKSASYQQASAEGIAKGISDYLDSYHQLSMQ